MSFVIGNTRLSRKGYHYFHALYYKETVTVESLVDTQGIAELIEAGWVNPIELTVGATLSFTGCGKVLAYLFYTNGESKAKALTQLCNWQENVLLLATIANPNKTLTRDELNVKAAFIWWLNKIKAGIALELFSVEDVQHCLGLPLELLSDGRLQAKPLDDAYGVIV